MKKELLLLLLLLAGMTQAQIVNIPDENFKFYLLIASPAIEIAKDNNGNYISIDTNNDEEIQLSEALAVYSLDIQNGSAITSFEGIESFENIREFKFDTSSGNGPLSMNFTELSNLEELLITNAYVEQIDVSGLANLTYLGIGSCYHLENVSMTGLVNLETLMIYSTFLDIIDLSEFTHLKFLTLSDNNFSDIDISMLPEMLYFSFYEETPLQNFIVGDHPDMYYAHIYFDGPAGVPSIDLSGCTGLTKLYFNFGEAGIIPRYLNLKNGVDEYVSFILVLNDSDISPVYVCIDEENQGLLADVATPNVLVNDYCSTAPGGYYNTITIITTSDADNTGCDTNDMPADFVQIMLSDNEGQLLSKSSNSDSFNFYTEIGTYTLTPLLSSNLFTVNPPTATFTFDNNNNNVSTQNFCITPNGMHPDVEIVLVPMGDAQPGFDASYKIVYKNKGNQTLSGAVNFIYDDTVLDYVSATPAESLSTSGTLSWNYSDLLPFESREIYVTLNLNGPMEIPAVNIDDQLDFTVAVTPGTGDETPSDNNFSLNQTVTGSFDPNDITCLQGDFVNPDKIGDYLHYNINFENTGTAPATFIVVKDIIDTAQFDVSSLQLLNASHDVEVRVQGNKVEFMFDEINLPALGKGNVLFKIKTLNTLSANDEVTQKADIFFDYNWPVETNDANTVFQILSRDGCEVDASVMLYPNPSGGIVNIKANTPIKSLQLYDVQGRLLQSGTIDTKETVFDITGRTSGIYFIKILTENGSKVEKVVKQ